MNKKNRKLIIISIISVLLVLSIAITAFAGNYLVTYALAVNEEGRIGSMGDKEYTGIQDTEAQREYDAWYSTIETKEWSTSSKEGNALWAEFYPSKEESHIYVLGVHGYTVDHRDIAPAIKPFADKGWNVLTPDQRGRGKSEGDFISMGWNEKDDVIAWINEIITYDKDAQIILYGESMGGASVMMASGEILPSNVVAVVEDCGYTSAYEMFKNQLKERFGLPEFPFLPVAAMIGKMRAGFDFNDASPIAQLEKATLPILFIHGGADDYVPTWMGEELYNSYKGEKELLIVEGAGHGLSSDVDPDLYYSSIFSFLDNYVK